MAKAERFRTDADNRAAAHTFALTELGRTAGYPTPQLAQDKPVDLGIRMRPGKLVVRHSSGGEAFVPHGWEALREV